jgi:hypothetical protein
MAKQSKDHDPVATPGKAVPDAIGSRSEKDKSAPEAADTITPGQAFGKAQHRGSKETGSSTNQKVPGKSVPDALRSGGKR